MLFDTTWTSARRRCRRNEPFKKNMSLEIGVRAYKGVYYRNDEDCADCSLVFFSFFLTMRTVGELFGIRYHC
jgi:hypothetical protein